jgi:hypothetical protein
MYQNRTELCKELTILKRIEPDPDFILKVKEPTSDEMELAFELKPELALHFETIPEAIQGMIVEKNPEHIKYVVNPTRKTEKYITFRGFADERNGNYYWTLANKRPKSISVKIQLHPVLGPPVLFVIAIRLIIARPAYLIYIGIRVLWDTLFDQEEDKTTKEDEKTNTENIPSPSVFHFDSKQHTYVENGRKVDKFGRPLK